MRALSANLTTAQQSQSRTPFVTIKIRPRDGDNIENFKTTDATNKILEVKQAEGRFGGDLRIPGSGEAVSAIIKLRDADGTLGSTDRTGNRVDIGWGLNTAGGDEDSISEPLFVFRQQWTAREGDLQVELYCFSLWDLLRHRNASAVLGVTGRVAYEANRDIKHILMELLGGFFPARVFKDDGGVFANETANAEDDDTPCVLFSATPQIGDAAYFGFPSNFNRLSIDLDVPGTGLVVVWEYSTTGSVYVALSNVVDGTSNFTSSGISIVSFDHPGTAWVNDTIEGHTARYIRARVTTAGSGAATSAALILGELDYGMALDSAIGTTNLEFEPEFSADYQVSNNTLIQELIELTTVGVILKTDGFHLKFVDKAKPSVDYTYDTSHLVYHDMFEISDQIPNQWIYTNLDLDVVGTRFTGSASDANAIAKWGTYNLLIVDDSVKSDADGTTLAERMRDRADFNLTNGLVIAPMNVGQEIWDVVQINDQWTSVNNKGIVTHILREYRPGVYQIELTMGGYITISERSSGDILNTNEVGIEDEEAFQQEINELRNELIKQNAAINKILSTPSAPAIFGPFGLGEFDPTQEGLLDAPRSTVALTTIPTPVQIPLRLLPTPGVDPLGTGAPSIEEIRRGAIAPPQRSQPDLTSPEDISE